MSERQLRSLLELDPDLGQLLDRERFEMALQELAVAVHTLATGPWDADKLSGASPDHVGILLIDGILSREVLVSDTVSTELLGPGDVLRPWRLREGSALLRHEIRWNVLTPSRIALLDRRFGAQLGRYPEVNAAILDRMTERSLRLAVTQAISQLNRVDRRLLALFWHLAERWGRMTADGVTVPMTLSHRMLGQLVGARRPTVSTALGELAKNGELVRRVDGTWLLTRAPVGVPAPELERIIPMRRRLMPGERPAAAVPVPPEPPGELEPVNARGVELRAALEGLRRQCSWHVSEMLHAYSTTTELARRNVELRDRCRETRESSRVTSAVNGGAAHPPA